MNTSHTTDAAIQTTKQCTDAAIDQAEALSHKLDGLCEIVKLAAFAGEARRALKGIQRVLRGYPGAAEDIIASIDTANEWMTFEDNTSSVLKSVAQALQECNQRNVQAAYDLEGAIQKGGQP